MQLVLAKAQIKFKEVCETRWLSLEGSVQSVLENLDSLMAALMEDKQQPGNALASGLLKLIGTYEFIAVVHFMADVMGVIGILCRTFQKQDIDFSYVSMALSSTLSALEELKMASGKNLQNFKSTVPAEPNGTFEWSGHVIKDSQEQRAKFSKLKTQFLDNLCENIHKRFECREIFSALCEWKLVKPMLSDNFRKNTFVGTWSKLLVNDHFKTSFPCITKIASIVSVIPMSTVDCERGFSRYNVIKSDLRNQLKESRVNLLMQMSVNSNTPDLDKISEFNFEKAFRYWCMDKKRRVVV
ncbi:UNVERIFIED_CONTAM: hypothetical protein FKN15_008560 [Acipenser sinensis]